MLIPFFSGLIIGSIFIGVIGWVLMPRMMLTIHQSRYDSVDQTCEQLKASIIAHGWKSPAIRNMNKTIAEYSVQMERQVGIVELCNAGHAANVLMTNPEVSTLMPCAWGVYEGDDGKIYISGMNIGLMAKMFGGNIAKVMGTVSKEEQQILKDIIRQ